VTLAFKESFLRDLQRLRERRVRERVREIIERIEAANTLSDIPGLKKLRGQSSSYRIRVGEYRIGMVIEDSQIILVKCLHRRELYRYFPRSMASGAFIHSSISSCVVVLS